MFTISKSINYQILIAILCFISTTLKAQENELKYKVDAFGAFSTGENTPFWMMNQSWGKIPLDAKNGNGYTSGEVLFNRSINKDIRVRAGLETAISTPHTYKNSLWIQQAYAGIDWKKWSLDIGSRELYHSLLDQNLSSGDFICSNNARPIPEIRGSLSFFEVPYTKGYLYIAGDFSIGKYLDGDWQEKTASPVKKQYTKDVLSHRKSISFQIGQLYKHKSQLTIKMYHQAQWGGKLYDYDEHGTLHEQIQPTGIMDLLRTALAMEGGSSASRTDKSYVSGSQIGSYTFRYDKLMSTSKLMSVYLQHFFDDGSGMVFDNYKDMLLGVQLRCKKNQIINNVVLEYLYTKYQTGPAHFNVPRDEERGNLIPKGNGNDNYYNNVDYVQGPSHFGRSMGTPLFLSPEYNKDGYLNFKSNRIIAFHAGIEGSFCNDFSYRLIATTAQTWGRYYVPFTEVRNGTASALDLIYKPKKLEGWKFKATVAHNQGEFFAERAFGGGITISKQGLLKF